MFVATQSFAHAPSKKRLRGQDESSSKKIQKNIEKSDEEIIIPDRERKELLTMLQQTKVPPRDKIRQQAKKPARNKKKEEREKIKRNKGQKREQ